MTHRNSPYVSTWEDVWAKKLGWLSWQLGGVVPCGNDSSLQRWGEVRQNRVAISTELRPIETGLETWDLSLEPRKLLISSEFCPFFALRHTQLSIEDAEATGYLADLGSQSVWLKAALRALKKSQGGDIALLKASNEQPWLWVLISRDSDRDKHAKQVWKSSQNGITLVPFQAGHTVFQSWTKAFLCPVSFGVRPCFRIRGSLCPDCIFFFASCTPCASESALQIHCVKLSRMCL